MATLSERVMLSGSAAPARSDRARYRFQALDSGVNSSGSFLMTAAAQEKQPQAGGGVGQQTDHLAPGLRPGATAIRQQQKTAGEGRQGDGER